MRRSSPSGSTRIRIHRVARAIPTARIARLRYPNGFEWRINAPAIDQVDNAYANSEDGNLYVIRQDGVSIANLFMNLAIGAAYAPLSLGPDGKTYTQNDGRLFALGH